MATSTTDRYVVSAAAQNGWCCRLQVPLDPYDVVCASLEAAARQWDIPITAAIRGSAGDVTEIVLLRDPSARSGTPEISRCEDLVALLTATLGWRRHSPQPLRGIVIPLGLRRGYRENAPLNPARDTVRRLIEELPGTRAWPVRLCSVRILHDGTPQWHHEPGLLIHAHNAGSTTCLAQLAADLGQDRFVVTDPGMTTAYQRQPKADF